MEKKKSNRDMIDILKRAHEIVVERKEEKERQYGDHLITVKQLADTMTALTGKEWTQRDCYLWAIVSKLNREAYHHKEDNLTDAAAYIGMLNEYEEGMNK